VTPRFIGMPTPENVVSSRRRFCGLLSAILFAEDTESLSADVLHAQGIRLLVQGKRFTRAAEYLELAAKKETNESKHPLALGCAYASRVASLIHAFQFTQLLQGARSGYLNEQKAWAKDREEARAKDPQGFNDADYEKYKPVPPPEREFPTRDDNRPLRLTETQLDNLTSELSGKALLAWESGLALSKTPEEVALACYIRGWGIRVLRQFLETNTESEKLASHLSKLPLKDPPMHKTVLTCFDKATEAAPNNPLYWQARGDALGENDEANVAYLKALELRPKNATSLWYRLYRRTAPGSYEKPQKKEWAIAEDYLKKAQARDRGNAWPLYEEAILWFCHAPYILTGHDRNRATTLEEQEIRRAAVRNEEARRNGRRAIDRILQGNNAPRYDSPLYVDSVPGLLTVAWNYRYPKELDSKGFARSRELARSAGAYGKFMASEEQDAEEAIRAVRAAIGMGYHLMGDWPTQDNPVTGKTVLGCLVGWAVAAISYKELQSVYEILGNQEGYDAATAESNALKKRHDEYQWVVQAYVQRMVDDY
jgi:hypothetical protein